MKELRGISAAEGIAIGEAHLVDKEEWDIPKRNIADENIPTEIMRLEEALTNTRKEILILQKKITDELGEEHSRIFDAHLLVLEDRVLIEEVISQLKAEKISLPYIFNQALKRYIKAFSKVDDDYIRERVADINDVGRRVLRHLLGKHIHRFYLQDKEVILVAYDLAPSQTAHLKDTKVIAFVTDIGGRTSHTAIIARTLNLPAVVGVEEATKLINPGDLLIVDGFQGKIFVNPTDKVLEKYQEEKQRRTKILKRFKALKNLPAETKDGFKVELSANIELPEEVLAVKEYGAQGIGLYRTEFFYMDREDLPGEDEQYQAYLKVAEAVYPDSAIIRTFDIGGDKFLSHLDMPQEMSPFLGWRAIRFGLARPDIFIVQLKAILRASVKKNLKIMYPMISGVEELREANAILLEAKKQLKHEKKPFNPDVEVGVMIEVPSAALTSDILAKEVNFFSVGTNDLIQYALAVDRGNEKVAYLYKPEHLAVLRLLRRIIDAAHQNNIWVGLCGEIASDPELVFLLIGMGIDELSMSAPLVPKIKQLIRSIEYKDAKDAVEKVLEYSTSKEVRSFCKRRLRSLLGDKLFEELFL